MAKRFIDTELDDKEWYMRLSCRLKCAVGFLFRKCDAAGIWEPNYILAGTYIGEPVTENEILAIDQGKQFEKLPGGKIFVIGFCDFQYGKLTEECKPHRPIIAKLKKLGLYERVLKGYQKGIERVQEKDKEKEMDKEQDEGGVGETIHSGIVPDMASQFVELNPAYPFDRLVDYPSLLEIGGKILKWQKLGGQITDRENSEKIKLRWGEIIVHIRSDGHFKKYSLSQINKHFQSIVQSLTAEPHGSHKRTPSGEHKPGTSEARINTAKKW